MPGVWREGRLTSRLVVLAFSIFLAYPGGLEAGPPADPGVHALLDVPYFTQTPELCGGAALAMVLRYWGERDVYPQDFASLVDPARNGIETGALTSAVIDRGWQATVLSAGENSSRAGIQSEVDRGRPIIALIEVAPATYHYVVVVGITDRDVVVHDPARAPFRVLRWAEFDRAWATAGRWILLVLPPGGSRPDREIVTPALPFSGGAESAKPTPCDPLVQRGVNVALGGDLQEAERILVAASRFCPADSAPWREMAGIRFSQSRWSEAAGLALVAARLAPADAYAWQLVATSRHLMGDAVGALDAWNRAGEPRIDTIAVSGADRTPQPVIVRAAGLQPRQVLTPDAYARASRRLREVPAVSNARVRYEPLADGLARIDVFVDERDVLPRGWLPLGAVGARALILDELAVDIPGGLGAGERARAAWRWSPGRPRVAIDLALPSLRGLPGISSLGGSWERQSYQGRSSGAAALTLEDRRSMGVQLADWWNSRLRWSVGASLDRWSARDGTGESLSGSGADLALEGGIDQRLAGDRLSVAASGGWWLPFTGGNQFGTGELQAAWRSTIDATRPSWSMTAGLDIASRAAPLALWQGAGTGQGRSGLLRAHPLLKDGVLDGAVFGRDVARASFESAWPFARPPAAGLPRKPHPTPFPISAAGFVDAAQAWHRFRTSDPSRLYVDAGVGLRISGRDVGGTVRIDVARGLRGGGTTLSAGWGAVWPR